VGDREPHDLTHRVGYLAPMRSELQPLVKHLGLQPVDAGRAGGGTGWHRARHGDTEVVATLSNIGMAAAAAATERILATFEVHHVVVVGIAGSIDPALEIGELVVPEVVVDHVTRVEYTPTQLTDRTPRGGLSSGDEYLRDPEVLADLLERGVIAVDMETAAVAAVCEARGVPWSVFRAISDRAGDADPIGADIMQMVKPDGSPNPAGVAKVLLTRPHHIPHLARLARGSRKAADTAARAAAAAPF
jgi:adenosylhomocysteine nucleosidase